MAFESTAINELIAAVQQQQLQRDSSDWLYDERDEATEIDARMVDNPWFSPVEDVASAVAPVPTAALGPAYPHVQLADFERAYGRMRSATTHVHGIQLWDVVKKLALPIAIISIVSVGFGVYFATTGDDPKVASAAAIATAKPIEPEGAHAKREAAAEPQIDDVKLEVSAIAVEVTPETTGEVAPEPEAEATAEATESTTADPTANPPEAADAAPTAETAIMAPAPAEPSGEQLNVEPGSPASRFLAPPPVEATIPTVPEKPAPAPTAVAGLEPPAEEEPAAPPVAERAVQRDVQKVAKTTSGRRPREGAQRAKTVAAKRAPQRVAAADAASDSTGKGILSIASTPAMEVWVNGRNSRAMTPIRIKLRAGKHVVTLIDKQKGTSRSFPVVIKADETTTVTKRYE